MSDKRTMNPLAPGLARQLSPEAEAAVAANIASTELSEHACPYEAAIRRDPSRDQASALRNAYLRDTEKIIHIPAYNRLAGKTQVFSFRPSDDIARRGLHVQLVARIARDIGRALALNEDLIEAIALAHDIGHTPFGHAGERFLNEVFHAKTGRHFRHNVQSVRVLDVLYGRNISLQALDGAICHNGEFEQQVLETSDRADFAAFDEMVASCWAEGDETINHLRPMTLEGCVVRVSDIIAYVGRDRQDAIAAKLLPTDAFADGLGGGYNSWALSAFSCDIIENSLGCDHIVMSKDAFLEMARAKRENYKLIYRAAEVEGDFSASMRDIFAGIYERTVEDLAAGREEAPVFRHHIARVEQHLGNYGNVYDWQSDLDLTAVDFISSMTDNYFVQLARHLFPEAADSFPQRGFFMGE